MTAPDPVYAEYIAKCIEQARRAPGGVRMLSRRGLPPQIRMSKLLEILSRACPDVQSKIDRRTGVPYTVFKKDDWTLVF